MYLTKNSLVFIKFEKCWLRNNKMLYCPGEGNGNPLQYSCLENPMDGEAWWTTVHGVTKSWTRLSDFIFTLFTELLKILISFP